MRFLPTSLLLLVGVVTGYSQYVTDPYTATINEVNDGLNQTKPLTPWNFSQSKWAGGGFNPNAVTNNYTPALNLNGGLSVSNGISVLPDADGNNPVVIKNDRIYDQNDGVSTGGEIVLDDGSGNLTLTAYGGNHQDDPTTWGHTTINGDLFNGTEQWGIYKNGQFWLAEGTSDQWSYIGNVDILNSDSANGYSSTIEDDGGKWALRSDGLVTADALQIATGGQFNNSMINLHQNIYLGQSEIVVGDANTEDAGTAGRISILNDGFTETIALNGIDGSASLLGGALSINNTESFFSDGNPTFNLTGASDKAAVFQGNLVLDDVYDRGAFLTLNSEIGSYITLEKNYDYGTCTQLGSDSSKGDGTFFFYKPGYGYAMQISVRDNAVYLNDGNAIIYYDGSASFAGGNASIGSDGSASFGGSKATIRNDGSASFVSHAVGIDATNGRLYQKTPNGTKVYLYLTDPVAGVSTATWTTTP